MSLSRLGARITRLEAQAQGRDASLGQGLSGVLADARAHGIVPLPTRTDAELDVAIANLTAQVAAGARGYTGLLLAALEAARAQWHARSRDLRSEERRVGKECRL